MFNQLFISKPVLITFILLHILIIAVSNYLVQLPVNVFGFLTTWGTFTFPLIFLLSDLGVRIFGKTAARQVVFFAMVPALFVSYFFSVTFFEGRYIGTSGFSEFNLFVFRIVIASFIAYAIGQLFDIQVFDRLRKLPQWWVAPLCSTFLGNLIDTICFYVIAFYKSSDAFMATHWVQIATVDFAFKLLISIVCFIPIYGVIVKKISQMVIAKNLPQSHHA